MNIPKLANAMINFALLLPAVLLCSAGILYLAFRLEGTDKRLEMLMATTPGKFLFSPFVVLGGPIVVVLLNVHELCHISAERIDDELVIALSIKRLIGGFLCVGLGALLTLMLLSYAFVENFKIVAR